MSLLIRVKLKFSKIDRFFTIIRKPSIYGKGLGVTIKNLTKEHKYQ